jgi:hypothetical protein
MGAQRNRWRTSEIFGSIGRWFTSNMDMKCAVSIGAGVIALGCLCALAADQGGLRKGSSQTPSVPWPGNALSNVIVIPPPGGNLLLPGLALVRKPELRIQTLPLSARLQSSSVPPTIPAGVYTAAPYSCIVVVPGPHPDDRCIINPAGGVGSAMPIIRPDLQLIPRAPAKQ